VKWKMGQLMEGGKRGAFTLIELLVAMAVLALLIVFMMGIVDNGTKLWRANENRVDAYREARAALQIMGRDLRYATLAGNTNNFRLDLQSGAAGTNYGNNVFFISALPYNAQDDASKSDLCEVGYFLAYDRTPASSNRSINLYRYFRNSNQTYSNMVNSSCFTNIVTGQTGEEILARNVLSMKITPVSTNSSAQWGTTYTPTTNSYMPQLVEISIVAINQDQAKKLLTMSDWTQTNTTTMKQSIQTFTTQVFLDNRR